MGNQTGSSRQEEAMDMNAPTNQKEKRRSRSRSGTIDFNFESSRPSDQNMNPLDKPRIKPNNIPIEVKIVIIGAGDGGKTTLFHQLECIFSEHEPCDRSGKLWRTVVCGNIIENIGYLCRVCLKMETNSQRQMRNDSVNNRVDMLIDLIPSDTRRLIEKTLETITPLLGGDVNLTLKAHIYYTTELWKEFCQIVSEKSVLAVFEMTREVYHAADGTLEVMKNLKSYPPEWNIDFEDILLSRRKTTGVVILDIKGSQKGSNTKLSFVDVGGQRNERRKWTSVLENVHTVVYCVAISEYNQLCYEDDSTNRLQESLDLFENMVHSSNLKDKEFILLFTKSDTFEEKLENFPFEDYFPDAKSTNAKEWIKDKFISCIHYRPERVHPYFVNLLDVKNVETMIFDNLYRYNLHVVPAERYEYKKESYRKKFLVRPRYELKNLGKRTRVMKKAIDMHFQFE